LCSGQHSRYPRSDESFRSPGCAAGALAPGVPLLRVPRPVGLPRARCRCGKWDRRPTTPRAPSPETRNLAAPLSPRAPRRPVPKRLTHRVFHPPGTRFRAPDPPHRARCHVLVDARRAAPRVAGPCRGRGDE